MPIIPGVSASSDGRQPTAPTIGTVTSGDTSASVPFTDPSYLGKPSTNNLYVALSSPGSVTASSATSPISVSGLTNGTAYTFTVTAQTRNSNNSVIATSLASSASNSVTPAAAAPPFFPPYFAAPTPVAPPTAPPVAPPLTRNQIMPATASSETNIVAEVFDTVHPR